MKKPVSKAVFAIRTLKRENSLLKKKLDEERERSSFFRLHYRTEIGFALQRLHLEASLRKMNKLGSNEMTLEMLTEFLQWLVERAEDETRCNDNCKGMYFCILGKGHSGEHRYW